MSTQTWIEFILKFLICIARIRSDYGYYKQYSNRNTRNNISDREFDCNDEPSENPE